VETDAEAVRGSSVVFGAAAWGRGVGESHPPAKPTIEIVAATINLWIIALIVDNPM